MILLHSIPRSEIIVNQYVHSHLFASRWLHITHHIQVCHKQESQICIFRLFQGPCYPQNGCTYYQWIQILVQICKLIYHRINSRKWEHAFPTIPKSGKYKHICVFFPFCGSLQTVFQRLQNQISISTDTCSRPGIGTW